MAKMHSHIWACQRPHSERSYLIFSCMEADRPIRLCTPEDHEAQLQICGRKNHRVLFLVPEGQETSIMPCQRKSVTIATGNVTISKRRSTLTCFQANITKATVCNTNLEKYYQNIVSSCLLHQSCSQACMQTWLVWWVLTFDIPRRLSHKITDFKLIENMRDYLDDSYIADICILAIWWLYIIYSWASSDNWMSHNCISF